VTVVYTVGHSTRSIEEFVALLHRGAIRAVIDVRAFPMSRRHPHFNRDVLSATLAANDITYAHATALGGRRRPRPDSPNGAWRNDGFRAYADHMSTPEFRRAIDELIASGARAPTTVMCAEAFRGDAIARSSPMRWSREGVRCVTCSTHRLTLTR
jgi:uncharacterized protein (DUF488 family)